MPLFFFFFPPPLFPSLVLPVVILAFIDRHRAHRSFLRRSLFFFFFLPPFFPCHGTGENGPRADGDTFSFFFFLLLFFFPCCVASLGTADDLQKKNIQTPDGYDPFFPPFPFSPSFFSTSRPRGLPPARPLIPWAATAGRLFFFPFSPFLLEAKPAMEGLAIGGPFFFFFSPPGPFVRRWRAGRGKDGGPPFFFPSFRALLRGLA